MKEIERTGALNQIYVLIPRVMNDIGGIAKTRKNEQQKYSFRGIEDFYLAAHPALIAHGVFCAPTVLEREMYRFEKTNEYGKVTTWCHVALKVEHRFYAPDGSYVSVTTWGEGLDNSDKASNKAMSGAMKYALIELFCVPTQDVEDSDRTTPEQGTRRAASARTTEDIPIASPGIRPAATPQVGRQIDGTSNPAGRGPVEAQGRGGTIHRPEHLPPVDELAAEAEAKMAAKPATLPPGVIETGQAANMHRIFKEALRAPLRKQADALLYDWLKVQGIVDSNGDPTTKAILKENFYDVREAAEQHARSL